MRASAYSCAVWRNGILSPATELLVYWAWVVVVLGAGIGYNAKVVTWLLESTHIVLAAGHWSTF